MDDWAGTLPVPPIFRLFRKDDITGVSGTGAVAAGVVMPSGKAVMEWRPTRPGGPASVAVWEDVADMMEIHGHGGATVLEWWSDVSKEWI